MPMPDQLTDATPGDADAIQGGLTDAEKRANVIAHAFAGDEAHFERFCRIVRDAIPPGTSVVLRGSAVLPAPRSTPTGPVRATST